MPWVLPIPETVAGVHRVAVIARKVWGEKNFKTYKQSGKSMFEVRYVEVPATEDREVQGMKTSCAMLSTKV